MSAASAPAVPAARAFSQELGDGILVLTLDVPGERVNMLGKAMLQELHDLLGELESRVDVRGVMLRSGKADNFIAGADIKDFTGIRSSLEGETLSRQAQAVLDRLAALKVPVVAAIHGSCLGGGLETALACRYRVASDHPKTSLGLPEVSLGLIPGAGGTQRLPRLVGLRTGLDLILTGRALKPSRALRAGLVDEVVPASIVVEVARGAAARIADGSLVPRRRGITWGERLFRPLIFSKARATVREKTHGHYPAPPAAIEVVQKGTATSMEEGLELEARRFGELAVSEVSRALVSVFFATQQIKKDAGYPEGTQARPVKKLAVVGAGLMGAGIAAAGAEAGVPVRLKDTMPEALARGMRYVRDVFDERLKRRRLTRYEFAARMERLSATLQYTGSGARTWSSRPSSRTWPSSGACSRRWRRPRATTACSPATPRPCPSRRSRATPAAPRASWACTSSRPCRRCPCSR